MTYCLAIKVNDGLVFASDSRTHAGVDYASVYSKMHRPSLNPDRLMVLLGAGSLATTQAVVNQIRRDLENPFATTNLNTVQYLFDAANYVGGISVHVQEQHMAAMQRSGFSPEASFILGGQIEGKTPQIYLIYPQGNYITASPDTPYLQIGETKYGKPILDRIVQGETTLEDAARCAVVSLDSTIRSNISVGPPLEVSIYRADTYRIDHYLSMDANHPLYMQIRKQWSEGIRAAFTTLPRFGWEGTEPPQQQTMHSTSQPQYDATFSPPEQSR